MRPSLDSMLTIDEYEQCALFFLEEKKKAIRDAAQKRFNELLKAGDTLAMIVHEHIITSARKGYINDVIFVSYKDYYDAGDDKIKKLTDHHEIVSLLNALGYHTHDMNSQLSTLKICFTTSLQK